MIELTLPDHPGRFLHAALDDFEVCEKWDKYEIRMGTWFYKHLNGFCIGCLAGATIAQRGVSVPFGEVSPCRTTEHKKLFALDDFRLGHWEGGFHWIPQACPSRLVAVGIPHYPIDPIGFKAALRRAGDIMIEDIPEVADLPCVRTEPVQVGSTLPLATLNVSCAADK